MALLPAIFCADLPYMSIKYNRGRPGRGGEKAPAGWLAEGTHG